MDENGKHTVFWRGNLQNDNNANGVPQFPGDPPSSVQLANNKGYATGYTWLMNPNLISNFRYGYTREGVEATGIQNAPAVTLRDIDPRFALSRGLTQIPAQSLYMRSRLPRIIMWPSIPWPRRRRVAIRKSAAS